LHGLNAIFRLIRVYTSQLNISVFYFVYMPVCAVVSLVVVPRFICK